MLQSFADSFFHVTHSYCIIYLVRLSFLQSHQRLGTRVQVDLVSKKNHVLISPWIVQTPLYVSPEILCHRLFQWKHLPEHTTPRLPWDIVWVQPTLKVTTAAKHLLRDVGVQSHLPGSVQVDYPINASKILLIRCGSINCLASSESDSEIPHDLPSAPCTINPPSLCVEVSEIQYTHEVTVPYGHLGFLVNMFGFYYLLSRRRQPTFTWICQVAMGYTSHKAVAHCGLWVGKVEGERRWKGRGETTTMVSWLSHQVS